MTAPARRLRCAFCSFEAAWPGELDHHQRIWHDLESEARGHHLLGDDLGESDGEPEGVPAPASEQERLW
jgi:hypothetical protein